MGLVLASGGMLFCCARAAIPSGSPATALAIARPLQPEDETAPFFDLDASRALAGDAGDEPDPLEDVAPIPVPLLDASFFDSGAQPLADDPMDLHHDEPEALRALMGAARSLPLPIGGPWRISQGNRAISQHAIGRRACMAGLAGTVLQTPAQLTRCGAPDMVPVWERGGSSRTARFCIDVFEFPDLPCELPFVFVEPSQADRICRAQGKRLCTQEEWSLSCRGDPAGGPDRTYAYGDDLDLRVCNTDKSRFSGGPLCDVSSEEKVWTTCGTNTEPAGSFPACRSRFGVYDQHGNVAEIMTRYDPADGEVKSQLKGSAFFYVDVAKKPTDPGGYWTRYPDDCNFDPRWHVEKLEVAAHVNYHLGFRCCKGVPVDDAGPTELPDAAGE